MSFPSTFLDLQNRVITKARLHPTADLPAAKDWINRAYFDTCVSAEAIFASLTATLTASVATYSLATTINGVNALNSATVNVASTAFFPSTGFFLIGGAVVTYTGKTATSFTGCSAHAATVGGELVQNYGIGRLKELAVQPAGGTQFNPPLQRVELDEILWKRRYGNDQVQAGAQSSHYALAGTNDLELWPTPPAADVLTVDYYAFPTPLSANTDVPVLDDPYGSNAIEFGALVHAGDARGDPATGQWQASRDEWIGKLIEHLDAKGGDRPAVGHQWGSVWGSWGG